eukprot:TRINITY_DN6126_c0_g1_i6.p2 TRINITY_DN6126_c0_g1~~TRINITY_DN6126_c0_g1_i6.p2  ORF type:complete len:276 (-),score=8.81 TRINITY_DN6126_c0_g1_i6:2322-3149(-)
MTSMADRYRKIMQSSPNITDNCEIESINMKKSKSLLEKRLSVEVQSPRTPRDLSFKDLVRRFDFQEMHRAKLLRKQKSSNSMQESSLSPSHNHIIRHESISSRKGVSVPVDCGANYKGILSQWVERYRTSSITRQREKQLYGRKLPLPVIVIPEPEPQPDDIDIRRCLSISEGQQFWDELVLGQQNNLPTSPRSVTAPISLNYTKLSNLVHNNKSRIHATMPTKQPTEGISSPPLTSSISTLDKVEEYTYEEVSVTSVLGGMATSDGSSVSTKLI